MQTCESKTCGELSMIQSHDIDFCGACLGEANETWYHDTIDEQRVEITNTVEEPWQVLA